MKHGRDTHGSHASGVLLGIDLQGTLEVSNSFALPKGSSGDDDGGPSRKLPFTSDNEADMTDTSYYRNKVHYADVATALLR